LYVSVGSDCNACRETNSEHAALLRLNLDGSPATNPSNPAHPMLAANPLNPTSPRVWASGLRNTIGFDWNPVTGTLWGVDQGSDGLGEETPPEEFNLLTGGKSYGWPFCWGPTRTDPTADDPSQQVTKEQYCATTTPSIGSGLPAHSSPIAFHFYTGGQFPAEYDNDAFLVLRGSWNRLVPDGYKVVRVHFANGQLAPLPGSTLPYEDFLAGFLLEGGTAHFGRIAGLTFDIAGALLVSDDTNGMIYRVSHGQETGDGGDSAE
jgi:glucose/arabinose dehydrogenase